MDPISYKEFSEKLENIFSSLPIYCLTGVYVYICDSRKNS